MVEDKRSPKSTRRIAQVTRALVACDLCRRLKTRCMREANLAGCLRCLVLKRRCSHEITGDVYVAGTTPELKATADRLAGLQLLVDKILAILQPEIPDETMAPPSPPSANDGIDLTSPLKPFLLSPYLVALSAHDLGPILRMVSGIEVSQVFDDLPEIDDAEALKLIGVFSRNNYPRWVSLETVPGADGNDGAGAMLSALKLGLTLLLYTCLVLPMRYLVNDANHATYQKVGERLVEELRNALSQPLWRASTLGTLQALTLLLIYSVSLSTTLSRLGVGDDVHNTLDPWYLSGIGLAGLMLAALMALHSFGDQPQAGRLPFSQAFDVENEGITHLRVYNHLCLIHLASCILSGRPGMVDFRRLIPRCRDTLSLPGVNNFDGRMISEIEILAIAYHYLQGPEGQDYPSHKVNEWHGLWSHLFLLQQLEFVQPTFHFCHVVMKLKAENFDVTLELFAVDKLGYMLSRLAGERRQEVLTHAQQALLMVNTVSDDYFAHLLDQIQFFFFFCAWIVVEMGALAAADVVKLRALIARVAVDGDILQRYGEILASHSG